MGFSVTVHREGALVESREIDRPELLVGKHSECDVVLRDPMVSRRHAKLRMRDGGIAIEDLGSTNGTSVGGATTAGETPVPDGAEIAIGPFRLKVALVEVARDATEFTPVPATAREAPVPEPVEGVPERVAVTPAGSAAPIRTDPDAPTRPPLTDAPTRAPLTVAPPAPPRLDVLGPLAALLADERVGEIMVNGPDEVWVERAGRVEPSDARFESAAAMLERIREIAAAGGRPLEDGMPYLDVRLADGSRVNVVLPPAAVRGPYLTIRRFPTNRLTADELVERGALSAPMLGFLRSAVAARSSILVSGGTGSGKTTVLNALASAFAPSERVVTIEDAVELRLPCRHVVPLEARPPDAQGRGGVTIRDLVRNALRMRPDRLVVGEVRGAEALDMLQAMNTGHEGSLSTIHANSAREALSRLETLAAFAGLDVPPRAIREQIVGAIRLVVHTGRDRDGRRLVTSVIELTGLEGDQFTTGEIFRWSPADGHGPTGYVPRSRDTIRERGQPIENSWFARNEG